MSEQCTWHPFLRWLLFLPAGFVFTSIAQFFLRIVQYLNGSGAYWGECLASGVELPTFLTTSLWVLPRGHRYFAIGFGSLYGAFKLLLLCIAAGFWGRTADGWTALLQIIGLTSTYFTMKHFNKEYPATSTT